MTIFQKVKIKDYCEITSSKRIFADEYLLSGVPFYRGKEISEKQRSSAEVNDLIYISREKFEEIRVKYGIPQKGDLLLTSVGTIGNPYLVKENEEFYFKDGNLTWFRKFNGINGQWLYYWLLSPQGKSELNKCTIGSSQKAYTINLLYNLQIDLPDFPTQTRIATVLSSYDDLIENNEKRIKTLEEMAQLLYTEWFVKFKFPNHEKVRLINSELGKIPEEWRVGSLDNISTLIKKKYVDKNDIDLPLVDMSRINSNNLSITNTGHSSELSTSRIIFEKNDILFGSIRPYLYKVALVPFKGVTNISVFVLRAQENYLKAFQAITLYREEAIKWADHHSAGTKMPVIKWELFKKMPVLIPDRDILEKFEDFVGPALEQISELSIVNRNLSQTRDLLIPQLVTGKRELK